MELNGYVQSAEEENSQHAQSLHDRHLQPPDHGDWCHENDEIRDDARRTISDKEGFDIYTLSSRRGVDILVPKVAVRPTLKNSDDNDCDPPANDEEENKVKHFAEEWHWEEPVVKKDDG